MKFNVWLFLTIALFGYETYGQNIGLLSTSQDVDAGYVLFNGGPGSGFGGGSRGSYLINTCGEMINSWESSYDAGLAVYLDFDGNLLRAIRYGQPNPLDVGGGSGGGIEKLDWNGNSVWTYNANQIDFFQHHDVEPLANGNVLFISWEARTAAEAIARGRSDGSTLIPTRITEVEPVGANDGNVIWQWSIFDHTIQDVNSSLDNFGVIADNPQLLDINLQNGQDWLHCNGIDYIPEYDLIVVSSKDLDEIFVIDHSTTTVEAASHSGGTYGKGGDLLYRWGNPENYDQGTETDQQINGQHGVRWIANDNGIGGKFGIFNNNTGGGPGPGGGGSFAIAIEAPMNADGSFIYTAGTAYGPAAPYFNESVQSANTGSNVVPLRNGNIFYNTNSGGDMGEFTDDGNLIWEYKIPVDGNGPMTQGQGGQNSSTFNAERYYSDFEGFIGKDLTPQGPIEGTNTNTDYCTATVIPPTSNFTYIIEDDNNVTFTDNSTGTDIVSYLWDFDNGSTSTDVSPNFEFTETGTFNVCLTVTAADGSENTSCQEVYVYVINIEESYLSNVNIYPNPSDAYIYIQTNEINFTVNLYDLKGKLIQSVTNKNEIFVGDLAEGVYFLSLNAGNGVYRQKVIVE